MALRAHVCVRVLLLASLHDCSCLVAVHPPRSKGLVARLVGIQPTSFPMHEIQPYAGNTQDTAHTRRALAAGLEEAG
jgi:hypothetical protein